MSEPTLSAPLEHRFKEYQDHHFHDEDEVGGAPPPVEPQEEAQAKPPPRRMPVYKDVKRWRFEED